MYEVPAITIVARRHRHLLYGGRERERGARDVGWPASKRGKKADRIVSNKQVVIIFLK